VIFYFYLTDLVIVCPQCFISLLQLHTLLFKSCSVCTNSIWCVQKEPHRFSTLTCHEIQHLNAISSENIHTYCMNINMSSSVMLILLITSLLPTFHSIIHILHLAKFQDQTVECTIYVRIYKNDPRNMYGMHHCLLDIPTWMKHCFV